MNRMQLTSLVCALVYAVSPLTSFGTIDLQPLPVFAISETADNLTWELTNGVLTISGNGDMITSSLDVPWSDEANTIKAVVVESGVTSIGDFAFRGCSNLVSVTLSEGITTIGKNDFKDCIALTDITFSNGLKSIGRGAFYGCTVLETVTLPNTLTEIGESAFESCTALKSIVIPDSVQKIGDYAFDGCEEVMICCAFGSAAYSYAKVNGHNYDDSYSFEKSTEIPEDSENSGESTSDTYVIAETSDLKKLANISKTYKSISLKEDIAAPEDWTPIADFNITFNGYGHKITGLNNCLFTTLGKDAVVRDLILEDVAIEATSGGTPIGAVSSINQGTIKNCTVTGKISCQATLTVGDKITWLSTAVFPASFEQFCAGGVTGINSGSISDCTNKAYVYARNASDKENDHGLYYAAAGGIAGENSGSIDDCTNTGSVSASVSTYTVPNFGTSFRANDRQGYTVAVGGGICGFSKGSITGCRSVGASASNTNNYSGKNYSSSATDEESASMLNAEVHGYAGGIVGALSGGSVSRCSVGKIGDMNGHSRVSLYVQGGENVSQRYAYGYCGGIAGAAFNGATINECSNAANPWISLTENGQLGTMSYYRCCGGILGAAYYQNIKVTNCYNLGTPTYDMDINAGQTVTKLSGGFFHGGLIGAVYNSTIVGSNQFETYKGSANVTNCYSVAPSSVWDRKNSNSYSYNFALINENTTSGSGITTNATFNNCYFPDTLTGTFGTAISEEEMKSKAFATLLGDAFTYQEDNYPVLLWETQGVKGDVNADGYLTVADVVLLQKWLLTVPNTKLPDWKAADLYEDNKLDVFDLVLLKRELINNM